MSKCYASTVLAIAQEEVGYLEKETNSNLDNKTANGGDENWTKYARDFDQKYPNWYNGKKNGYDWCDMFVDWCFLTAFGYTDALCLLCQPEKSAGAGCTYSLGYYKNKGQFHRNNPKPGDQIFFGYSISNAYHTGIVEKVDSSKVYTIEGNTSERVARRTYALNNSSIVGYGRPNYDAENSATSGNSNTGSNSNAGSTSAALAFKVGDIVQFTGKKHYSNANAASGPACKSGKAKVTAISKNGKHPYHLIAINGSGSNVYGWVDADDVKAISSSSTGTAASGSVKVEPAQKFDEALAGTYKTTADLNLRTGAGTDKKIMLTMPEGKEVKNYGYYTKDRSGTKWLYVVYEGVAGFCSSEYLRK